MEIWEILGVGRRRAKLLNIDNDSRIDVKCLPKKLMPSKCRSLYGDDEGGATFVDIGPVVVTDPVEALDAVVVVGATGLLVVGFSDVGGTVVVVVVVVVVDVTVVGTVTVVGFESFVVGAVVAGSVGGTLGTSVTVCPVALPLVEVAGLIAEVLVVTWGIALTVSGTAAAEFAEGTVSGTSFAE